MELRSLFVRMPSPVTVAGRAAARHDPTAGTRPDSLRGRRLAEMVAFFAVLVAIDHAFFAGGAFVGVDPHPFWGPVLLMTVTYGSGMGLVSALVATIIWVVDHGPLGAGDHLERILAISIMPMLWTTSALVIGEITSNRLIRLSKLAQNRVKLKRDLHKLVDMIRQLLRTNRDLQVRIALEERTLEDAFFAAAELVDARGEQRTAGIERLVRLVMGRADFIFYHVVEGRLVPVLRSPGAQGELALADLFENPRARGDDDAIIPIRQDCHAVPVYAEGDPVLRSVLLVEGGGDGPLGQSRRATLIQVARSVDHLMPRPDAREGLLMFIGHPRAVQQEHAV